MSAFRSTTFLAWLLGFLLVVTPTMQVLAAPGGTGSGSGSGTGSGTTSIWGMPFDDAAASGQAFGKAQMPDPADLFGTGDHDDGYAIFPGSGDPIQMTPAELFGSGGHGDTQDLKDLWSDDKAINEKVYNARQRLDASETWQGEAYRTLTSSSQRMHPDLTQDPVFDTSKEVMGKIFTDTGDFSACTVTRDVTESTRQTRIHDYRFCTSVVDDITGHCTVTHPYTMRVFKHVSGPLNIQSCGSGCITIWLGEHSDNDKYHSGIYEKQMAVRVLQPDAIISATLIRTWWDDYLQVWMGGQKVWWSPGGQSFGGYCDNGIYSNGAPGLDVTSYFKNLDAGDILQLKTRLRVCDIGEGYAQVQVHFDPRQSLGNDVWEISQSCQQKIDAIETGFATGTYICTDMPSVNGDCATIYGSTICLDKFKPSPIPTISPFCRSVEITSELTFNQGQMDCWTDPQGVEHCPTNDGSNPDACAPLESNPACVFVDSECLEGAEGPDGFCYAYTGRYDCGQVVDIPSGEIETTYQCPGGIRCMGGDCIDIETETNDDFGRAVAMLQAADYMAMDMHCPDTIENDNSMQTCRAFSGEAQECKVAVGGIQDCCDLPVNASLSDYITMMRTMRKISGIILGDADSPLHGTWTRITKPITDAWGSITDYFGSALDANSASTPARKIGLSTFKQAAMRKTAQFMIDSFGVDAASLFFEGTGGKALGELAGADGQLAQGAQVQLGGAIGSMLSVAMTAYAVYVFAKLAIQMIWKCTQDEFQLRVKRELKSTHYIGSYCATEVLGACIEERRAFCTFASPLSRILQEQIRPQLSMSWGSAEDPDCRGITVAQIQQVDWTQVDLSEWLAILVTTDNLPSVTEAPSKYSIDQLTQYTPTLDVNVPGEGPREDVVTRNEQRLASDDTLKRNEKLRQHFWGGEGDLAIGDETVVCEPGHALFVHLGAAVTFPVPANCNELRIAVEGGDSGFADNIPGNKGGHSATILSVSPTDELLVMAGGGGGIEARWNEYSQQQDYIGLAGTASWVKWSSGPMIASAAAGGATATVHTYAPPYWQGQSGWARISWGATTESPPDPPEPKKLEIDEAIDPTPCVSGYQLFLYTGAIQSFKVPINCIYLNIVMEGGDSGGASNIPGIAGQHVVQYVQVTPDNTLSISVGAGGGVKSFWEMPADKPAYIGLPGGNSAVLREDGDLLLRALGAPRTPIQRTGGTGYYRGQNGWVLIGYGPSPGTPPAPPGPTATETPPVPEPPCEAGQKTFSANGQFTMPRGCHHLEVIVAGAGGGSNGGDGALIEGDINLHSGAKFSVLVGAGGSAHVFGNTWNQITYGDGGGRSAMLNAGNSPVAVAGGGGGGGYQGGAGGDSGMNGQPGSLPPSCQKLVGGGGDHEHYVTVGGIPATGGTQSHGGTGGVSGVEHVQQGGEGAGSVTCHNGSTGQAGYRRQGGSRAGDGGFYGGGGGGSGGDGYYGGGGGAASGGGGGSSYVGGLDSANVTVGGGLGGLNGARGQDGWVVLEWSKH